MNRRRVLRAGLGLAGLNWMQPLLAADSGDRPVLVVVELSGGNDGLNSVVPFADDAYYRARPTLGIPADGLLSLDEHFGFNPGMLGLQRLWHDGHLAIVHGCGYARPSYSHFTAMAYWHTGIPHRGSEYGWLGRTADQITRERTDDMLINVAPSQSLAVNSRYHTPVVFDDPERFQRHAWMEAVQVPQTTSSGRRNLDYLNAVDASAAASSQRIRRAWEAYSTPVDYGIAPMDLPKVAACIAAGLPTQLYHVAFRNNAFDTHVQQADLHQRLLSYACDGLYGFVRDLERTGHARRVVVLVYSEFGRRVPQNANLGTDHGSANVMFVAGQPVAGGHYGKVPSLVELVDGDNLAYTTDFRQVYATLIERWLKLPAAPVLGDAFETLDFLA